MNDVPDSSVTDVGVFDSGVGGVSVLRELRATLPYDNMIYVADSKYVPYGTKAPGVIRERSSAIVRGRLTFLTTGEPDVVRPVVEQMWGEPVPRVERLVV